MAKKQAPPADVDVDAELEEEPLRQEGESVLDAFVRYQRTAVDEGRLALDALIPPGFKEHGREAKRNFKRSFKVLLEGIAARIDVPEEEKAEGEPPVSTTGKTKVKVEVT